MRVTDPSHDGTIQQSLGSLILFSFGDGNCCSIPLWWFQSAICLFLFHPSLPFLCTAFIPVSIETISIVSLTVKRNLTDVRSHPTPSSSYFDSIFLSRCTNFLALSSPSNHLFFRIPISLSLRLFCSLFKVSQEWRGRIAWADISRSHKS